MNCNKPYVLDGNAFGCGQCIPCRINKRREWTHRMMLEAALHGDNCFCTLTYDEEHLPNDLSVSPKVLSVFIRGLRKRGHKVRYFGCGEYGDHTFRPHYHIALFGFPTCAWGTTRKKDYCCPICSVVRETWGRGQILLGSLEPKSMAYVAGYITKKMTRDDDPRLEGRLPEFARMSLRPGIGYSMMHEVASTLMEFNLDKVLVDVPAALTHGRKSWPLGRYLRRNLRTMLGREANAPKEALDEQKAKLQPLREAAFNNSRSFKSEILKASLGKRIRIEAMAKLYKKDVKI